MALGSLGPGIIQVGNWRALEVWGDDVVDEVGGGSSRSQEG